MRTQKLFDNSHFGYLFREWREEHNISSQILPTTNELKLFIKDIPSYELNEDNIHNWLLNLLTIENISVSSENGRKLAKQQFYLEKYGTTESIEEYEKLLHTVTKELKNIYINISDKLFEIDNQIFEKQLKELEIKSLDRKEREKESKKREQERKAEIEKRRVEFEKKKADKIKAQKERKAEIEKRRVEKLLRKQIKEEKYEKQRINNFKKHNFYGTDAELNREKRNKAYELNNKNFSERLEIFKKDYKKYNKSKYSIEYIVQNCPSYKANRLDLFKYLEQDQDPIQLFGHRDTYLNWRCLDLKEHTWNTTLRKMEERKEKCRICSGHEAREAKRASGENLLINIAPELEKEYHRDNKVEFNKLSAGSGKKVLWQCPNKSQHIYEARIFSRANGSGCLSCNPKGRSLNEIIILFELSNFYNISKKQKAFKSSDTVYYPDIHIPEIKLIVEYDGSYWHKDSMKRDLRKNRYFESIGYKIIRIREHPLKKIKNDDIVVKIGERYDRKNFVELKKAVDHIITKFIPFNETLEYTNQKLLKSYSEAMEYYQNMK